MITVIVSLVNDSRQWHGIQAELWVQSYRDALKMAPQLRVMHNIWWGERRCSAQAGAVIVIMQTAPRKGFRESSRLSRVVSYQGLPGALSISNVAAGAGVEKSVNLKHEDRRRSRTLMVETGVRKC
jgi:hypothetical protein